MLECKRRANDKYNKEQTKHYSIRLSKSTDGDLIEAIEKAQSKNAFIREALRKAIQEL